MPAIARRWPCAVTDDRCDLAVWRWLRENRWRAYCLWRGDSTLQRTGPGAEKFRACKCCSALILTPFWFTSAGLTWSLLCVRAGGGYRGKVQPRPMRKPLYRYCAPDAAGDGMLLESQPPGSVYRAIAAAGEKMKSASGGSVSGERLSPHL